MKSSEGSHAHVSSPASHRFPNFADGDRNLCTNANTTAEHDQFQPLFHTASASSTHQVSDDHAADGENQMEQARQRGYRIGFETGRQDACQMANNLLAPHVDRFQQNLERLTNYQQHIADHASMHMIKLSVAIAERIIGTNAHITIEDLQDLRRPLIEAICKKHELHLSYHPQDLSNLQHLMECKGANHWQTAVGLSIAEDDNLSQGSMINGRGAEENPSLQSQIQSTLQQLLKKAE